MSHDQSPRQAVRLVIASVAIASVALGAAHSPLENVEISLAPTLQVDVPTFTVDDDWPKPLPHDWLLGMVASVAVDSRDHVWILHRPAMVAATEIDGGKTVAPPVIEFDPQGNVVQAWGGPAPGYSWMETVSAPYPVGTAAEHGIAVDHEDNIWVTGNGHVALKFTRRGEFLLQIGELWKTGGSNDTRLLGNPTDVAINSRTNEIFVADGYVNRRVIVFDADTGAYKRHWGAYGQTPDDGPLEKYDPHGTPPRQFFQLHGISVANDGFVYASDRQRNRVQAFQADGTFVREVIIETQDVPIQGEGTGAVGSTSRTALSGDPEQQYLYVGDSANSKVWILRRSDLQTLGSVENAGGHHIGGPDASGNIYIVSGRRVRRLVFEEPPSSGQ